MTGRRRFMGVSAGSLLLAAAAPWLGACGRREPPAYAPAYSATPPAGKPVYLFGIHPLHNPETLEKVYGPLLAWLDFRVPECTLQFEASTNYAAFEAKLAARQLHFALPNSYQLLLSARYGYRVFAKMGDDELFRGLLLVRKDSNIREVADLRGKALAFPAPTALAATLLPQALLAAEGLDVQGEVENRYVGSQESAILNAYLGNVAAAGTWSVPWRKFQGDEPEKAAQLRVAWETPSLPNNGLVVRDDVPADTVERLRQALLELHQHPTGRALLERIPLSRFESADAATYEPVRRFLERFSASVRPIALP